VAEFDVTELVWRRSSASGLSDCVEIAVTEGSIIVRHSKNPAGPTLTFSESEWRAFLLGVRNGEFDR
jgi:hypothetical protein